MTGKSKLPEVKTKNQHQLNLAIENFIKEKDRQGESYTTEEKDFISQYSGSGGLASKGAEANEGLLYEFYTPLWLCEQMWKLANHCGYDGGTVLEPSVATGNLIHHAPDYSKCVGFETNPASARICEILHPGCKVHTGYFETAFLEPPRFTSKLKGKTTWLKEYPFSLVIGNPPYGRYRNLYSSYFDRRFFKQVEIFFIYQGLQMLKPEGLMVYVLSSNFLRTGDKYDEAKKEIEKIADFVDAYRLPTVFKYSEVPTDIMVLRKK